MTAQQKGDVYRYFRADADKDISGDDFALSADNGVTWHPGLYIAPADWPDVVIAVEADPKNAPEPGLTGYWYRVFTGPGLSTAFPLNLGSNLVRGKCVDNPEIPWFAWRFTVRVNE